MKFYISRLRLLASVHPSVRRIEFSYSKTVEPWSTFSHFLKRRSLIWYSALLSPTEQQQQGLSVIDVSEAQLLNDNPLTSVWAFVALVAVVVVGWIP